MQVDGGNGDVVAGDLWAALAGVCHIGVIGDVVDDDVCPVAFGANFPIRDRHIQQVDVGFTVVAVTIEFECAIEVERDAVAVGLRLFGGKYESTIRAGFASGEPDAISAPAAFGYWALDVVAVGLFDAPVESALLGGVRSGGECNSHRAE